jgi:hypothetical protein
MNNVAKFTIGYISTGCAEQQMTRISRLPVIVRQAHRLPT